MLNSPLRAKKSNQGKKQTTDTKNKAKEEKEQLLYREQ